MPAVTSGNENPFTSGPHEPAYFMRGPDQGAYHDQCPSRCLLDRNDDRH
jgi:hypothetical protein